MLEHFICGTKRCPRLILYLPRKQSLVQNVLVLLEENYIEKLRCSTGLLIAMRVLLLRDTLREYMYYYLFLYMIHEHTRSIPSIFTYNKDHEFTPHRVPLSFFPFHICNPLLWQLETSFHYLINLPLCNESISGSTFSLTWISPFCLILTPLSEQLSQVQAFLMLPHGRPALWVWALLHQHGHWHLEPNACWALVPHARTPSSQTASSPCSDADMPPRSCLCRCLLNP